ncbi:MAG TPA: class I SAM-dependent methyltransferase [Tepidisphaeraceae bacterium]|nr:class I SAM-dependent methyltransferase [Tepidisphaeraceae bacterium]
MSVADQFTCPACREGEMAGFFEVAQSPILCNILCRTRADALAVPRGRIHLGFCPACGHVYNTAFDEKLMQYDAAYENSLQFSPHFRQYLESAAAQLVERYGLRGKDVIEIGCGQGDFLSALCRLGGNRGTGFDPSFDAAKAETTLAEGARIVPQYYSHEHKDRPVDLLCCRHVLEHIPRPLDFLRELRRTMGERRDVVLFFEVPNALFTLQRLAIWDIIYEHCSYFTPQSLRRTFELAGFEVLRVAEVFDGQFLTIEARPADAAGACEAPSDALRDSVARFEAEYRSKVKLFEERFDRVASEKRRAVVWGGGSKGVTFLNTLRLSPEVVPYVVDVNPRKEGHYVVGTGQQIVPPRLMAEYAPHAILIMNATYRREIESTCRGMGIESEFWCG